MDPKACKRTEGSENRPRDAEHCLLPRIPHRLLHVDDRPDVGDEDRDTHAGSVPTGGKQVTALVDEQEDDETPSKRPPHP